MIRQFEKGDYTISTDKGRLDLKLIHTFLASSYWAEAIPIEVIEKSVEHSLCYGVYHKGEQAGFARVITDLATFAYLADVFIVEAHRGRGLSKWMMSCIMADPDLAGVRRWMLVTRDAHGLYSQFGFAPLSDPRAFMEIRVPNPYKRS